MKLCKILAILALGFNACIFAYPDYDNPPNPIDAKTFLFTIVNKTDMPVKSSFFFGNKKHFKGVVIEPGKPYTFEIDGRYNKKDSYFRFRKPGADFKGTGFRFYYKGAAKAKRVKIDQIYLFTDENGTFVVSANDEINPSTTILKADINQKLE